MELVTLPERSVWLFDFIHHFSLRVGSDRGSNIIILRFYVMVLMIKNMVAASNCCVSGSLCWLMTTNFCHLLILPLHTVWTQIRPDKVLSFRVPNCVLYFFRSQDFQVTVFFCDSYTYFQWDTYLLQNARRPNQSILTHSKLGCIHHHTLSSLKHCST